MADVLDKPNSLADPAKGALGGRKDGKKPTDLTPKDLEKMTPDQQVAAIKDAEEAGKKGANEGSLKIHINLDLEVELQLSVRVKGDITIGLL